MSPPNFASLRFAIVGSHGGGTKMGYEPKTILLTMGLDYYK